MESFTFLHLWKRHAVLMLISAGHSSSRISELLKVTEQFVRTVRRESISSDYDYEGVAERKHSRRSDTIRDAEFVTKLQAMVDEDPSQSIARELSEVCLRAP
ncbi:hypothetical protein GWK47_043773 [Chionoecetes opilio]|uniref:Uncharacterized protein n=1 Tax=Chionoecetes opilio TaxID=41210 RepID=A0A8J4Y7I0_CHIOP|nr:hypothetical protein GWK47_043773 [Chionoecetes opilio]